MKIIFGHAAPAKKNNNHISEFYLVGLGNTQTKVKFHTHLTSHNSHGFGTQWERWDGRIIFLSAWERLGTRFRQNLSPFMSFWTGILC